MNRFLGVVVIFSGLQAQSRTQDTLSTVSFPEIVVIATRSTLLLTESPSPVEVLRNDNIGSFGGTSADQLLLKANGIVLQDLGGEGALKTASVRGTATQHLLILVNGNRLTSFQNGLVDLSLLPLADIDRIEILRGGSSALYGADALGGVVNILTRSAGPGAHARAEVHAGSFGFRRFMMEGDARVGSVGLLAGMAVEEGRDNYAYSVSRPGISDTSLKRDNADFRRKQMYVHGDVTLDRSSVLSFMGQVARSESGVPGSVSFPSPQARQTDDNANLQLNYQTGGIDGIDLEVRSGFHYGLQNYIDPNPLFPLDTYYHNSSITVNPQLRTTPFEGFGLTFGGEIGEARLRGGDFSSVVKRAQQAFYLCSEFHWTSERAWGDQLSIYASARYDDFSDVDRALTPKVGMNVRLLKEGDIRLRASFGRSFRAPSFNDLYFVGFNNPTLRPERSTSTDIGVIAGWDMSGRHSVEITWYSLDITNRIIFDLNTFRPENIGRSSSRGLEARYSGRVMAGALEWSVNYTLTDTRKLNRESVVDPTYKKQLPFIPAHLFNVSLGIDIEPVTISFFHFIAGRRFTNSENSQSLPIYRFTNVSVSMPISVGAVRLRMGAAVENVFDLHYSIVPEYPMPGRRIRAGVRLEY